jgi:predicted GIY-YIG superfamily endonuclease
MQRLGHRYLRSVYVFEFKDGCAYVGLTKNLESRKNEHLKRNKIISEKAKKTDYEFKELSKYVSLEKAVKIESEQIEYYKKSGWTLLNKAQAGSLGGTNITWTKDKCAAEANKYKTRADFKKGSRGAYSAVQKNGWLDEICSHMEELKKPNGYWTKERCADEAKKFKTRKAFRESSATACVISRRKGWMDEFFPKKKQRN